MPVAPTLAAWLFASFVIACALTWLARVYAVRNRLIDQPGKRRSHVVATPRGGGVSIVVVMLLALAALALHAPDGRLPIALTAAGLVLVAAIGWIDDHRPLSPWLRLGVHAVSAGLLAGAVSAHGGGSLAVIVAFGAALVLTNVWNFMDGIDALAASQAALVALAYALFAGNGPVFWLGLALAAAACGFLPFNWPRARIFLGDVGSGALGYLLAGLWALLLLQGSGGMSDALLLSFTLLPFLLDASLTLLSRIVRREAWWTPHVQHAYQGWARRSGSHLRVTLAYGAATMALALVMFGARSVGLGGIMFMYVMLLLVGGLSWQRLRARHGNGRHGNGEGSAL